MKETLETVTTDLEIMEDQAQAILDQIALARATIAAALAEISS